ncbi:hypothetical protein KTE65_30390 [Burkholderia multivorans]|nr:hypothetical protein [Burkholderia multivorans]MBU9354620.1 hypothetical protein [Burkholderia multivorans]
MTTNNTNISGVPTASNEIDPDSLIAALDALQPNARLRIPANVITHFGGS